MHLTQDQVNERLKNKGFLALDVPKDLDLAAEKLRLDSLKAATSLDSYMSMCEAAAEEEKRRWQTAYIHRGVGRITPNARDIWRVHEERKLNARQAAHQVRWNITAGEGNMDTPDKVEGSPPNRPNVYTDGAVKSRRVRNLQ